MRMLKRLMALLLLVGVAALLTWGGTYLWIARQTDLDQRGPADVIVVLGAAVWPGERPSPTLYERTRHGVDLFHEGHAPYLLVTGGLGQHPPTEAEVMRRLAVEWGVPEDRIILEDRGATTSQSAALCAVLMAERGLVSALLVSDGHHLPRAKLAFQRQGVTAYGSPALQSPMTTLRSHRVYHMMRETVAWWFYLVGLDKVL
jgi:uncharacterized SAM-binding protein YcdF (DUF218 family)